jgi:hypothetical protein
MTMPFSMHDVYFYIFWVRLLGQPMSIKIDLALARKAEAGRKRAASRGRLGCACCQVKLEMSV